MGNWKSVALSHGEPVAGRWDQGASITDQVTELPVEALSKSGKAGV